MVGKKVGGAIYVHKDAVEELPPNYRKAISKANRAAAKNDISFNVVKAAGDPISAVSFLLYEDFDRNEFPALLESTSISLENLIVRKRSYKRSKNPPILHRKELLLKLNDARKDRFADLTADLEQRGVFKNPKSIGFRQQWQRRLAEADIKISDHKVVKSDMPGPQLKNGSIRRHRTAITRQRLSKPMQALARHGFLEGQFSVFDYGCGQGDDLTVLATAGITAYGWDPHYVAEAEKRSADLVNLGFVLNVIEDPVERVETVEAAYNLAERCLAVAVLMEGTADTSQYGQFGDGIVTSRGTFQKYFTQHEIKSLLEEVLGQEAIPVGTGIFFLFRDKLLEQTFLADRHKRKQDVSLLLSIAPSASLKPSNQTETILEEHRDVISDLWAQTLRIGRIPELDELDPDLAEAIVEHLGSVKQTAHLAQYVHDVSALTGAKNKRTEDLSVYFALNLFNKRQPYGELPSSLKRDIKAFFGAYNRAESEGKDLLFSLGDPEVILSACEESSAAGIGHMFGTHSMQIHADLVERLPAVLRAYVGCAEVLYGDLSNADVVKIHVWSGKVTLLRVENFDGQPLPKLVERIKVRMRDQDVEFFDHSNDRAAPRLTMKSRYMAADQEGYDRQAKFDAALDSLGLFDFTWHGPTTPDLVQGLKSRNLKVSGFELAQIA